MNDLETKFVEFDTANPKAYRMFDRFAWQAVRAGRTVLSAKAIFERMRWQTFLETTDEDYKLNNNYHAYYARLWMLRNPTSGARFRTRTTAGEWAFGQSSFLDVFSHSFNF